MKEHCEIDPFWHLPEAVSLREAACLVAGYDPTAFSLCKDNDEVSINYPKYFPAIRALKYAVRHEHLKADIGWETEYDEDTGEKYAPCRETSVIDLDETIITVENLKNWLLGRGFKAGFFFPTSLPDYLDKTHLHYSPKLAAAISVWEAVTSNTSLMRAKSPKQAMMIWLRINAQNYGLSKEDGNPNEQGVEEIAKIANWDSKGGAPKTPPRKMPAQ